MSELERALLELAADVEWPPTPRLRLAELGARPRRQVPRAALVFALVAVAFGAAFAVPQARSALLRFFHLGGVTVERVNTLPPARNRPLTAGLGSPISRADAQGLLGEPVRLPTTTVRPRLYEQGGVVSAVVALREPVLVSEFRSTIGAVMLKKAVGDATLVEPARVFEEGDALWVAGVRHLYVFPPAAPRLAGNVLIWTHRGITFRLEGRHLVKEDALKIARGMTRWEGWRLNSFRQSLQ